MKDDEGRPGGERGLASAFAAAMRGAARLTRDRHLGDATRLVRLTRSGRDIAENPTDGFPREMSRLIFEDTNIVLSPPEVASAQPAVRGGMGRPRHPLGTVVDFLHRPETNGRGVLAPPEGPLERRVEALDGAAWVTRTYSCPAGSRDYRLYVPAAEHRAWSLIVMLHGCSQTPDDFAAGTGMNALAEEHGFIVAYPKQSTGANQSGCWNWFNPEDQARNLGEPSIIAGLTRGLVGEFAIDPRRVFVAGLSAGGAMAAILSATYPDLFRAVGIHSGLAYGAASDLVSAFAAMRGTPLPPASSRQKRRVPRTQVRARTIIFHGTDDQTVHPSNGEKIFADARLRLAGTGEETLSGCSPGGLFYTRHVITDANGLPQAEHWTIEGLGHAWSGGRPDGSYTDFLGPDASREMVRFFLHGGAPARG